MLVLSRKKNEGIVLNGDIVITVVEIRGDKVRLGITAPAQTPVHRQEVFDAIHGIDPYPAARTLQSGWGSGPTVGQLNFVEISLSQLIHELGSNDAEVDRTARFTNEGAMPVRPNDES